MESNIDGFVCVLFRMDGCGHCVNFKKNPKGWPAISELDHIMINNTKVPFMAVEKELKQMSDIQKKKIDGFPTIYIVKYANGSKELEEFVGGMEKDKLVEHIQKKYGVVNQSGGEPPKKMTPKQMENKLKKHDEFFKILKAKKII